ncbi:MAG: ROK family protein [Pseudomonadales bacterium]|nr:ROK family protein [Pseudomonadales bacterium]
MTDNFKPRIGVDLGGSKIEAIVLDGHGDILVRRRVPTPSGYEPIIDAIVALVHGVEDACGLPHDLPVGIGTPGAVSLATGRMKNSNTICLNDRFLREDLARAIGAPVRIANDANCLALSEASDGAGSDADTVFAVILGTGVGGGLCVGKRLLVGRNAIAGEWGHNTLPLAALRCEWQPDTGPRNCYCGRADCIETWLSGPGLARTWRERSGRDEDAATVLTAAENGDEDAARVVDHYTSALALALAGIVNIVDPDTIVLAGGVSNAGVLYAAVTEKLPEYVFSDGIDTRIVKARHGDSSGVRGAAWLFDIGEIYPG